MTGRVRNGLRAIRSRVVRRIARQPSGPLILPAGSDEPADANALDEAGWTLWCSAGLARARLRDPARPDHGLEVMSAGHLDATLFQDVAAFESLRSHDYLFEVWVRGGPPGAVRLWVDDGVTEQCWADPSAGSPQWERVFIEGIVSHASTRLRLNIQISANCEVALRGARFSPKWVPAKTDPTLADLVEDVPDEELPLLDRREIDERGLSERQQFWRDHGYLILPGLIPDDLVDAYCAVRERVESLAGYDSVNPYHEVEEIKRLCLYDPLMAALEELIGEPMGMHLNLTGWVSTDRSWHQDDYLNPPSVNNYYAAAWFALDEISPDAGPFEFIPGSHRWFTLRRDRVLAFVPPDSGPVCGRRLRKTFSSRHSRRRSRGETRSQSSSWARKAMS